MTTDELDRLEQIAKAATPGPWKATGLQYGCFYILTDDESGMVADDAPDAEAALARARGCGQGLPMEANAAHIAAFHPETAQQLITALRTEREARETAERERDEEKRLRDTEVEHWVGKYNGLEAWRAQTSRLHLKAVAERDALAQQVDDLETHLDCVAHGLHHYSGCTNHFAGPKPGVECCRCRAEQAESALTTAQQDAARLREALEKFRSARADVVSWAPMLRNLRDTLARGAENIDLVLVAVEYPPESEVERAALTAPADPTGGQG